MENMMTISEKFENLRRAVSELEDLYSKGELSRNVSFLDATTYGTYWCNSASFWANEIKQHCS